MDQQLFPLIKLAKKLKVRFGKVTVTDFRKFPLIKLAKKLKETFTVGACPTK